MPDFTLVPMHYCTGPKTCGPWRVPASNGRDEYFVRYEPGTWEPYCSCPAFAYSRAAPRTCKHLAAIEPTRCGWGEQWGRAPEKEGECPECGGEATVYMTAT